MQQTLDLTILSQRLSISRLDSRAPLLEWAAFAGFCSVTRTDSELSIVCDESVVPDGVRCERGFRALVVAGPIELNAIGVIARLSGALAAKEIPIFVLSTFDTDYILVRESLLQHAVNALRDIGCRIEPEQSA